MTSSREPTPQDRLIASRKAILRHMTAGDEVYTRHGGKPRFSEAPDAGDTEHASGGTWQSIKRAVRVWWHHHPAQLALDLAKPVLGKYAEEKPLQLLGIAAGLGAAVVLVRPWRLVSVTGLAVATLKSSEVSGLLLSLLSTHHEAPTHENHN